MLDFCVFNWVMQGICLTLLVCMLSIIVPRISGAEKKAYAHHFYNHADRHPGRKTGGYS